MKKIGWAVVLVATAVFVVLSVFRIQNAPIIGMNTLRPVASVAFAKGLPIFYAGGHGPEVAGLNGPIPPVLGLPMALAATPHGVMLTGSFLSLLYSFLPIALLFWLAARRQKQNALFAATLTLIFALFAVRSRALASSLYLIHADAGGLCFSALAVVALGFADRKRPWRRLGMAATAVVAAALCKITFLPMLVATALFVFFDEGRRAGLRYVACEALAGVVLLSVSLAVFGSGLYFSNIATVAGSHWVASLSQANAGYALTLGQRLKVICAAANELFQEYGEWLWLALPLVVFQRPAMRRPWALSALCAFCLIPPSILGRVKAGGDFNTQSPFVYFLLLTLVLLAWEVGVHATAAVAKRVRLGATLVLVAAIGLCGHFFYEWNWTRSLAEHVATDAAFDYLKAHPGAVYFPQEPLAHLMAEGKLYHSWGTISEFAGNAARISEQAFKEGIPQPERKIAFLGDPQGPWKEYFKGYQPLPANDDLVGWTLFAPGPKADARGLSSY